MAKINPYITFNGNCEQAFEFYKSAFGGDFQYVGRFKEMPDDPRWKIKEEDKNKIMHISLPISKETILMGSDTTVQHTDDMRQGNNFSISIHCDSVEESERLFYALSSDGGIIRMPLEKTFWGSYYGMFTDKFDVNWMINCDVR